MALIDDVQRTLNSLASGGWSELFAHAGLNIGAANLKRELLKPLNNIDRSRSIPGFEDFAPDATRGIEPGSPSHSLLYHALASPNVQRRPDGTALTKFPTLKQLDMVENLVFGIETPTLSEIRQRVRNSRLSVVVFACDYRPASHTSHRRHADIMFSRTGVSRVGTAKEEYNSRIRGFIPFIDGEAKGVRVLPCRYSAYLAVKRSGSERDARPMRFQPSDSNRDLWVPVHKLFDGDECLRGVDALNLKFTPKHLNEKLRRIHTNLQGLGINTGVSSSDLRKPPFQIRSGLAKLGSLARYPKGHLVPVPHEQLVERAMFNGRPAVFPVPRGSNVLASSLFLSRDKSAPEFVHARHKVENNGSITNLNGSADVAARVTAGGYNAQHYLDFTADGVVLIEIEQLMDEPDIDDFVPSYSIVAPPDFFPLVDQRELTEWTTGLSAVVPGLQAGDIWGFQPQPLCDDRFPANLQFPDFQFNGREQTVTAVVSLAGRISGEPVVSSSPDPMRHSNLPDDAAGLFDPGWDVSTATNNNGVQHLAAYGLGSPFPEDAKLCAAISAFWPAVAPDIARSMEPINPGNRMRTVTPATDQEIGIGSGFPWDGVEPLKLIQTAQGEQLEYASFDQADYVEQAIQNNLTVSVIGRMTAQEYQDRVLTMALFYKGLDTARRATDNALRSIANGHGQNSSLIYSFKEVATADGELMSAQQEGGVTLIGPIYAIKASSLNGRRFRPSGRDRVRIAVGRKIEVFVSARIQFILLRRAGRRWNAVQAV